MSDTPLPALIGARVHAARTALGLSLGALARAAGVGKGSLSEIEHGTRNPTLGTLYALAAALDVPLSWLLAEHVGAEVSSPALTSRLLDADSDDEATVEVYLLTLPAGGDHRSEPHGPGVVEHLLVTRGAIEAGPVGAETVVRAGAATSWTSDTRHRYRALDDAPARAVLTIRWPAPTTRREA